MTSAINGICNRSRCIVMAVLPGAIFIYSSGASPAAESSSEQFAIHGQATYVEQETSSLRAPYSGPNSLCAASTRGADHRDLLQACCNLACGHYFRLPVGQRPCLQRRPRSGVDRRRAIACAILTDQKMCPDQPRWPIQGHAHWLCQCDRRFPSGRFNGFNAITDCGNKTPAPRVLLFESRLLDAPNMVCTQLHG
jgi:hypothetical protein